ncbi:MAG: carbohydrate kinase family protein [Anaerolineales bacterium]|nr:carbohydrate kinase family protein [Anaerolineales bacterium]
MNIVITGSIAFDYLMTFPGHFQDHILPDQIDRISLSFLVDRLTRFPGGVAANIAYTLALLGEKPKVMAPVGFDYSEHAAWLAERGVDTSLLKTIPELFTASFFVSTDLANAQIASFYPGAMERANNLSFRQLETKPDLAIISPNEPAAMTNYSAECAELGIDYFYDPSQQIVRLSAEDLVQGTSQAKALFSNDYEFGLITNKTGEDLESMLESVEFIVITRGDLGIDLITKQGTARIPAVPPERIVDPTGVGDSFRGGFLKGYAHALPLERCAEMGAVAAAFCLESEGPQTHTFEWSSFLERYREHFDDQGALDAIDAS